MATEYKNSHKTKKASHMRNLLAEWTGLEPATPCVTGMYSNQLNYHSVGVANIATIFYSTRFF
jgi:hypothetical protein